MDRMVVKGLLAAEKVRNLTIYRSAVTREQAQRGELFYALKHAFNGALTPMVQCLLDTGNLSAEELAELEALIKAKKKGAGRPEPPPHQPPTMNALIEALNVWADHALRFAWPMLWQSSLLIGLLFALDLLLKRKVRPAVRYALWLVVLVKLLLPPSLAFPTSAGWWLRPANAAPARPRPTSVVVTYGAADVLTLLSAAPTALHRAATHHACRRSPGCLLGTVAVSLGLLAWLIGRWRRVARNAR